MVRSEPLPTDFILIAAGNVETIKNMHPALRSRIRGYGYEIYMNETMDDNPENREKIVVFVSEFKPKPQLINSISSIIMKWVTEKKCKMLISPEGMVVEGKNINNDESSGAYAIGSTVDVRRHLAMKNISQFKNGIIAGVSGVLLNKGKHSNFDVISILTEAHPNYPDAKAAAAAINIIALITDIKINVAPLYEESERIEKQLQKFHKQAKPMVSTAGHAPQPNMYG